MLPVRVLRPLVGAESGRKGWWWWDSGGEWRDMTILRKGGVLLEGGESEERRSGSKGEEEEEGMPKTWLGRLTCFAIRFFLFILGGVEVLN